MYGLSLLLGMFGFAALVPIVASRLRRPERLPDSTGYLLAACVLALEFGVLAVVMNVTILQRAGLRPLFFFFVASPIIAALLGFACLRFIRRSPVRWSVLVPAALLSVAGFPGFALLPVGALALLVAAILFITAAAMAELTR